MNALVREVDDAISGWPRTLPWPQTPSVQINWDRPTDDVGTLAGPTRFRFARPNASPTYEFEIYFTAEECEEFEAWYNNAVDLGGELYLPWVGEGRILAFTEYELSPLGRGWKLHALAVQLYRDPNYCDRHVCDAANAIRMPVIVDADANYPIILCQLWDLYLPRLIDPFFAWKSTEELTDVIVADLAASDVWINIPENWKWEADRLAWYEKNGTVFVDDWETLAWDSGHICRLLKDILPPPYPIVENRDWLLTRIIANNFPLATYKAC